MLNAEVLLAWLFVLDFRRRIRSFITWRGEGCEDGRGTDLSPSLETVGGDCCATCLGDDIGMGKLDRDISPGLGGTPAKRC